MICCEFCKHLDHGHRLTNHFEGHSWCNLQERDVDLDDHCDNFECIDAGADNQSTDKPSTEVLLLRIEVTHSPDGVVLSSFGPNVLADGETVSDALTNYCEALLAHVREFGTKGWRTDG